MSAKFAKDGRQSVRYSIELYEKLKEQGWTIQKLLDWAIEQKVTVNTKIRPAYDFAEILRAEFLKGNKSLSMDEDSFKDFRIWAINNGYQGSYDSMDFFEIDAPEGILRVKCNE